MRQERVNLNGLSAKTLDLGYVGEANHVQVVIVCSAFFAQYPSATVAMAVKPPVGSIYPVSLTIDNDTLVWNVSTSDIANPGSGQFQLTFTEGEEVIKTAYGSFTVKGSMVADGEPPEPIEDWLEEAQQALSDLEAWDNATATATQISSDSSPTLTLSTVSGHKNFAFGIPKGETGIASYNIVSGGTPSITGVANNRYICGTVSTISITPPEAGMIDVIFTSGSTPAVLTVPNTVTFPGWFDSTSLEANTTYEINIADGFGVVTSW